MGLLLLLCAYWNGDEPLLRDFAALPRAASETLAACASGIDGLTCRYRYMEQGFVISRGLTYPIALEAALKTQETCYVKMKGYSAADFTTASGAGGFGNARNHFCTARECAEG